MARLRKKREGLVVVKSGQRGFGNGCTLTVDKTLTVTASARDCLELAGSALRDWYAEAHRTGQRFDAGMLPRDSSGWVGYDTGLLATRWRVFVSGDDVKAGVRVYLAPPDRQRAARLASLVNQGIRLSGLSGKALDVYTRAVAQYMSDAALTAE